MRKKVISASAVNALEQRGSVHIYFVNLVLFILFIQMKGYPSGNLSVQPDFKRKHQRHSFRWFLKNIATEVLEKYEIIT